MLNKSLSDFIRDERGSYTMWSVAWFMIYVGIGGLAVDGTDVYRHETLLQATGDASSLAGVMSLPNETEAVDQALAYAQDNMQRTSHGTVLAVTDVKLGTWNFDERTFRPGTADPNAVYVTTRREEANNNALRMNMLRFLSLAGGGDLWWNVNAESVAVRAVSSCHNNGLIAGGELTMSTGNVFKENMCLHAVEHMKVTERNDFKEGVSTSTGCDGDGCVNSGPNGIDKAKENDGFDPAWTRGGGYDEPLQPFGAQSVDTYIGALREVPIHNTFQSFDATTSITDTSGEYSGWEYMFDGGQPIYNDEHTDFPSEAVLEEDETATGAFTVYDIDCAGNGADGITLPDGKLRNIAIIANCPVKTPASVDIDLNNVVIASTWVPQQPDHLGIHFRGHADLGGSTSCTSGGVELYTTKSSIKFAAAGQVQNTRIISGWDVEFAANAEGEVGVHVEAVNDIKLTSGSTFGLCPDGPPNGVKEFTYRLVE